MFCHKISLLANFGASKFKVCRKMLSDATSLKKPILYGDESSPPVRFVMMAAKLLNADLDFHLIDLFKGDNKTEEYKKINPLQKVPALSTDGQTICDSHAIAVYLCRKLGGLELYPEDILLKAKVDQMLYFDATTLFPIDSAIYNDYFASTWPTEDSNITQWYSAINHLETLLNQNKWLTGDKMRLCDICCGTTVSSLSILLPLLDRHVKVKEWMKNLDEDPCFEINRRGLERLSFFVNKFGSGSINK